MTNPFAFNGPTGATSFDIARDATLVRIRRHKGVDGWGRDSYNIPPTALVGASDTGLWIDSPAPSDRVGEELLRFCREVLKPAKCRYRIKAARSGNIFMVKRWITVPAARWASLIPATLEWLENNHANTVFIHDANLNEVTR